VPLASPPVASLLVASAPPSSPAAGQLTADGHTHEPLVHTQLVAMVVLVPSHAGLGDARSYSHWSMSPEHAPPGVMPFFPGQLPTSVHAPAERATAQETARNHLMGRLASGHGVTVSTPFINM
jgi:hypothetical protein